MSLPFTLVYPCEVFKFAAPCNSMNMKESGVSGLPVAPKLAPNLRCLSKYFTDLGATPPAMIIQPTQRTGWLGSPRLTGSEACATGNYMCCRTIHVYQGINCTCCSKRPDYDWELLADVLSDSIEAYYNALLLLVIVCSDMRLS